MASTINTNISSLTAQRNLGMSQASLNTSIQRLSSGLRINTAKDDAAGLAISERFTSQIRGLNQAARNANDGISLAQTAEGALGKVGDMLQRMRELAVQSSNATNSKADRQALQAEVKQLSDEIDRVAKQTSFNGQKILDGSFAGAMFQVGANSGENITVGALTDSSAKGLADVSYSQTGTAINIGSTVTDAIVKTKIDAGTLTIKTASGTAIDLGEIKAAGSGVERLGQVVAAINNKSADTGVTAFMTKKDDGTYDLEFTSAKTTGTPPVPEAITFTGFSATVTGFAAPTLAAATTTAKTGIDNVKVDTQKDAWVAIKKIDSAIDQINSARADLGALQSRFENTVGNIETQSENLAASRGRIVDADFAKETANLSRTQILQQAGVAMVAQANQLPQGVLSLLR